MSMAPAEVSRILDEQRATWNSVAAGWDRWQPVFERGGTVINTRLFELAGLRAGQHVLDVGTGLGEPAAAAAAVVGPGGWVLGIDPAPEMIRRATRHTATLPQLTFQLARPEAVGRPHIFDVVLSRLCLMFVPDRATTLQAVLELLRPGGVLAAAVWSSPDRVPVVGLPFQVLTERLDLPRAQGSAGPYAMADPQRCHDELAAAGFTDISVTEEPIPFRFHSAQEYAQFARGILPGRVQDMLRERFGTVEDPETWAAVAALAERFAGDDGRVVMPSTAVFLRAVAPGARA